MPDSPPPSPSKILAAQLLLEKAKKAKTQAKKPASKAASKPKSKAKAIPINEPAEQAEKENPQDDDAISWHNFPKYTDKLISIIEENHRYRQAFGFKGDVDPGVTSGGLTIAQICRNIGQELFPDYTLPVNKLGASVKNRVNALKKTYAAYHKQLQQTGHGLIMADREDEIISGSPIGNVWEKMKVKFPWYRRLHLLLCGSPVYDVSALANSATPLNTSVLTAATQPTVTTSGDAPAMPVDRNRSPDWDMTQLENDFNPLASAPLFDDDSDLLERSSPPSDDGLASASAKVPSTPVVAREAVNEPPNTVPSKRKNPFDQIKELSKTVQNGRLESDRLKEAGKRQRALIYSENQLAIERLKHEDSERQRQHELALLDKQIQLARLQAAGPSS
ncbi:hypothetical protein GALMADRAFT_217576 [Galerina marginata CBS 339.88]|uniref:Uncharacterized protein n=1 Tax=Galerina marginata (strain CBS 339.88) TaxID=685588 RepID=A0A067S672_GALM3|nr:hypothetical protein GALMADRAFT_217576 [Galerina marginata CBS 339.88]